jgi:hypothetical protein
VLANARLQASLDRPIPEDLDLALNEMVELRHVLTHRAGRVDDRALAQAPFGTATCTGPTAEL